MIQYHKLTDEERFGKAVVDAAYLMCIAYNFLIDRVVFFFKLLRLGIKKYL